MLDNEIHRNPVVSEARNDNIRINDGGKDEVPKGIFDKFVVLLEYTDHRAASLDSIPLESAAESNIICFSLLLPSQLMKIL